MSASRHRRPIAWLAIRAVLVAALVPSVSRALASHFDGGAAERDFAFEWGRRVHR